MRRALTDGERDLLAERDADEASALFDTWSARIARRDEGPCFNCGEELQQGDTILIRDGDTAVCSEPCAHGADAYIAECESETE
jgi:hypothetical protein